MSLRRYEHPGKFEGGLIIDEHVYSLSLLGDGETVGSDDGGESYTRLDGPFQASGDVQEPLNEEEVAFLAQQAGAILYESSDGFVDVTYYASKEALNKAWTEIEAEYAGEDEDQETPNGWDEIEADDKPTADLVEIEFPPEFLELCHGWAMDSECMLRAIDSTGNLTLGSIRPYDSDEGRNLTDQEWHVSLWSALGCDIRACIRLAEKSNSDDLDELRRFEQFAEYTEDQLRKAYGLDA